MEKCAEEDATCVKRKNKYMHTHTRTDTYINLSLEGTRQPWLPLGWELNGWWTIRKTFTVCPFVQSEL